MLDHTLPHVNYFFTETKTQVFDQKHEEINKLIVVKKVSNSIVDEQDKMITVSTAFSFLCCASNPPKLILKKTIALTTDFTCLLMLIVVWNKYSIHFKMLATALPNFLKMKYQHWKNLSDHILQTLETNYYVDIFLFVDVHNLCIYGRWSYRGPSWNQGGRIIFHNV